MPRSAVVPSITVTLPAVGVWCDEVVVPARAPLHPGAVALFVR